MAIFAKSLPRQSFDRIKFKNKLSKEMSKLHSNFALHSNFDFFEI